MKNLLITIVVLLTSLFIGCQENSITEPNLPSENELLKTDIGQPQNNVIEFNNILNDPYPIWNSYYVINGQIDYQFTRVEYGTYSDKPSYIVYLNLSVKAEFTKLCTVCEPPFDEPSAGTILVETNDTIYLTESGKYSLEKSFLIQGREDVMYLVCSFIVTPTRIELDRMELQLEKQNETDRLQTAL